MGKLSDDILKWTLDVNGSPARKELTQITNSTNKLERANKSLETAMAKLEAQGKKGSTEWKSYEAQIKKNNVTIAANKARMGELRKEVGLNNLSARELRKEMRSLKQTMDGIDPNTAKWKELNTQYTAMQTRLTKVRGGMSKVNSVFGAFKKMAPWLSVGAVAIAFKRVVTRAVEVRSEFSRYMAVLENTLGSQKEANEVFSDLTDFAENTPFQLNELTSSYVKLVNQGFKPTFDEMENMGDLASSMGKSFDQLTEAILDAQVGENERLKEFGIRAQKEGNKIKYTFKGVTTEVDYNAEAIRDYIVSLGEMQGVAGGMAKISKTIGGAISNAEDAADSFWNTIGKRLEPGLVKLLSKWTGLLDVVSKWVDVPTSDKLQKEQTELNLLVNSIVSVNDNQRIRNDLIQELQEKYPDFLGNIDAEKISNEELLQKLNDVNDAYLERIRIAVNEEEIRANEERMQTVWKEQKELVKQINRDYEEYVKNKKEDATLEEKLEAISKTRRYVQGYGSSTYASNAGLASIYKEKYIDLQEDENKLTKEYNDLIRERSQLKTSDNPEVGTRKTVGNQVLEWDGKKWNVVQTFGGGNGSGFDFSNYETETEEPLEVEGWMTEDGAGMAEYLAAKKAGEEEWTEFLTGEVEKRMKLSDDELARMENELEFEKAAAQARAELKEVQTQAIGEVAGALTSLAEEGSAAYWALFAVEKGAAIAQVWVNYAKESAAIAVAAAEMNAISFGIAGTAWGTVMQAKAKARAIANTALIGAQAISSAASGSKKEGGYAETSVSDDEPKGIYHANEFIGNAQSVRNPTIKRVYDIIDHAQKNGTVSTLNLPALLAAGKKSGGYASSSTSSTASTTTQAATNNESLQKLIKQNTTAMKALLNMKIYTAIEDVNTASKRYTEIQNTRGI